MEVVEVEVEVVEVEVVMVVLVVVVVVVVGDGSCGGVGSGIYVPCAHVEIKGQLHGVIFFLPSLCGL